MKKGAVVFRCLSRVALSRRVDLPLSRQTRWSPTAFVPPYERILEHNGLILSSSPAEILICDGFQGVLPVEFGRIGAHCVRKRQGEGCAEVRAIMDTQVVVDSSRRGQVLEFDVEEVAVARSKVRRACRTNRLSCSPDALTDGYWTLRTALVKSGTGVEILKSASEVKW